MSESGVEMDSRFSGAGRLLGRSGFQSLREARILVIGIGGVGSWTAEALARSGAGHLTLCDMDEICVTNINRQVHALSCTVGRNKVEAMRERIASFAPDCRVDSAFCFFTEKTAASLLEGPWDVVIDAIDSIPHKCLLISECVQRNLRVVTVGGAGGRRDPTRIQIQDLTRTCNDALLQRVRKRLRQRFGFPRNTRKKWGILSVFSPEAVVYPRADGSVCGEREEGGNLRLDCESGYGTVAHVAGAFGFAAAAAAIRVILEPESIPGSVPPPPRKTDD